MSATTKQFASALLHGIPLHAVFAVASLVWMAGAQASLVAPDLPRFVIGGSTSTPAASSGPGDSAYGAPADQRTTAHAQMNAFDILNGSTLGMSSGPTLGSGNASNVALRPVDAGSQADLAFYGWVTSEMRFSLPDPPGNDLLRPPQMV